MITRKPVVDLVAGARPNFMKLAPVVRAIAAADALSFRIIHTGQHYDEAMNDVFFQELGIPAPDVHLEVGSGSHGAQTAKILERYEAHVQSQRPDATVVFGDVNSTVACALAAVKLGVPVAHVEAGLRSFDRTMPEEINRILTDAIAGLLLVSEASGVGNLRAEGVADERVRLVGNVMIDTLQSWLPVARARQAAAKLGLKPRSYGFVTLHRPSNVDDPETLGAPGAPAPSAGGQAAARLRRPPAHAGGGRAVGHWRTAGSRTSAADLYWGRSHTSRRSRSSPMPPSS